MRKKRASEDRQTKQVNNEKHKQYERKRRSTEDFDTKQKDNEKQKQYKKTKG